MRYKYVMCIDDLVDGISKYKIYKATSYDYMIDNFYEIVDDYGMHGTFRSYRFIEVTSEMIKNIEDYIMKKEV